MKVALVHDWLTGMRGGERCLEVFCELFPDADLFTLLHVPASVSPVIERRRIVTSFIQRLPDAARGYRRYLPLFPFAVRRFDLHGYDLVLSSSHAVAKSVRVPAGALHVCYCFTPMGVVGALHGDFCGRSRGAAPAPLGPFWGGGPPRWGPPPRRRCRSLRGDLAFRGGKDTARICPHCRCDLPAGRGLAVSNRG